MAVKILRDKEDISKMPIEYAPVTKKYNSEMCKIFGIEPLADYEPIV